MFESLLIVKYRVKLIVSRTIAVHFIMCQLSIAEYISTWGEIQLFPNNTWVLAFQLNELNACQVKSDSNFSRGYQIAY